MKTDKMKFASGLIVVVVSLMLLASCGGGDGGDDTVVISTGNVRVVLTDNQDTYNSVVLTIKEVGVVASNTPTTYYNSSALDNLPVTVDLLDYPGDATLHLADIKVVLPENGDPLCFSQVRLVLAAEGDPVCPEGVCNYVLVPGNPNKNELKTPSGQQSGVKILAPNDFCVAAGDDTVQVAIDFDPATAIVQNANNHILKPTGIRIIEGSWSTAPDSFIDGLVAVPTYNSATGCDALAASPLVTVAAYDQGTTVNPVVQTVTLAEGPVSDTDLCADWCAADANPAACAVDCDAGLSSACYYSGNFKLLLPGTGPYDVIASWENMVSPTEQSVQYNSSVLLELPGQ